MCHDGIKAYEDLPVAEHLSERDARLLTFGGAALAALKEVYALYAYGVVATGTVSDDPHIKANADRCIDEARELMAQVKRAVADLEGTATPGGG